MITDDEYRALVQECLELLERNGLEIVADRLLSIVHKPVVDETTSEGRGSKDIYEARERERTPQEEFQAIVCFLDARLLHPVDALASLAEATKHAPSTITWATDQNDAPENLDFEGSVLSISDRERETLEHHLRILKQAAGRQS